MKFKVGDKVKNIITGNVGKVKYIDKKIINGEFEEEVDKKLGAFKRIYYVAYPEGFASWHNIVEIEKVEEILDEKEKEYLSNVIKPFEENMGNYKFFNFDKEEFLAKTIILEGRGSGLQYSKLLFAMRRAIEKNETQYIITTINLKSFKQDLESLQKSLNLSIGNFKDYIVITNGYGFQLLKILKLK